MQATRDFSHYVKDLGAGLQHIDLAVEGVSCAGCMSKIERGLSAFPGVTSARMNLTDRRIALEWQGDSLDPSSRGSNGWARQLAPASIPTVAAARQTART